MTSIKLKNKNKRRKINRVVSLLPKEDYFFIEITYPKEEAVIFRQIYEEKIQENENKLLSDDSEDLVSLMKENNQLKMELEVFNKWNPQ